MSDVAIASSFARRLVEREARASNLGMREAASVVARHLKLSGGTLFGLLYQPPKKIGTETFRILKQGVVSLLEQELRRLSHEKHVLTQTGADPRADSFSEVEAHLAAARQALGLDEEVQ